MKISWGYKVTILYLSFAGLIAFMVTRSMKEQIDLVSPDYYEYELKFENQKEATEHNLSLAHPAEIWCDAQGIRVELPSNMSVTDISGTVHVFRPSDKNLDFTTQIDQKKGLTQRINSVMLTKGLYRVKLEYENKGVKYYLEKPVVVR